MSSGAALQQHVAYVTNRLGRVQSFRTNVNAIHDTAATKHAERIIQTSQTILGFGVAAVGQEAIGLQRSGWTEELVRVPPEGRAAGRAASA